MRNVSGDYVNGTKADDEVRTETECLGVTRRYKPRRTEQTRAVCAPRSLRGARAHGLAPEIYATCRICACDVELIFSPPAAHVTLQSEKPAHYCIWLCNYGVTTADIIPGSGEIVASYSHDRVSNMEFVASLDPKVPSIHHGNL